MVVITSLTAPPPTSYAYVRSYMCFELYVINTISLTSTVEKREYFKSPLRSVTAHTIKLWCNCTGIQKLNARSHDKHTCHYYTAHKQLG